MKKEKASSYLGCILILFASGVVGYLILLAINLLFFVNLVEKPLPESEQKIPNLILP